MDDKSYPITTELFEDRDSAERAYQDAINQGYEPEEINVLMSEDTRKKYYDSDLVTKVQGDKSMEGLAIGGSLGGAVGGILAAITALGTNIVIPGLGLVIVGPLAAGLVGAGAGSITGGLIGSMIGWGIPEERAKVYEAGIKKGGIVLGVKGEPNRSILLKKSWEQNHPGKTVL